jgi:serine/threonine-protein kinase
LTTIRICEFAYVKIDANLHFIEPMQIGTVLRNRYQIHHFLGSGGFGDTYLAEDLDLPGHPQCVVKHLKPKNSAPSILQAARVLFDREAKVLYDLGNAHDQIPRLFAHIEENNQFYLVQEFVEGHTLSEELIVGQPWSEARVVTLLREILEVLSVVHQRGVIHRDIKPQNLMRRQQDQKIVLIDFGAVKEINALATDADGHTTSTIAIGTAGYMPPEQAHGHPQLASDVYAVGVLGIQALLGRMPQQDSATGDLIWKETGAVSSQLARVLEKMTCYHFRDRYASAQIASNALVETVMSLRSKPPIQEIPDPNALAKTVVRSRPHPPINTPLPEALPPEALAKTVVDPRPKPKPQNSKSKLIGVAAFVITGCTALIVILASTFLVTKSQNSTLTSDPDQETQTNKNQQLYTDEIKKYDEAIQLNPQDASAYYNRGLAKYNLGNNEEAIQDYDEAIRLNPEFTNAYFNRGLAYYTLENYQEAIPNYDQAIQLNPQDASAYYNRGLAQYKMGEYQEAINNYDEAIKLKPKYTNAYYNRGLAKYDLDNNEGAIKDFDEAILLDPKDANAYYSRGNARYNLKDNQGALKDYDEAIRLSPENTDMYVGRGNARDASGDRQGALKDYDEAIRLSPENADAYQNRGITRAALDDKEGALQDYRQSADLYQSQGQTENHQKMMEKIQKLGG